MCTPVAFGGGHMERALRMMRVLLGFKERKSAK